MEAQPATDTSKQRQFPCKQCGANLIFAPGTNCLTCPYCGTANEVAFSEAKVEENDYRQALRELSEQAEVHEQLVVKCTTCAAETTLPPDVTASTCPFCGGAIVATGMTKRAIRPQSVLPFKVKQAEAADCFRKWVGRRWFAPSALKKQAERAAIHGTYVPAWTYDADASTDYTGRRGDDYQETETYTERDANGQDVTRTRTVTRTRWTHVSGHVEDSFDDVLVMATETLPPKHLDALQPWDLKSLVPYQDDYLSGFVAEAYQVGLADGFERAKGIMAGTIRSTVCREIGGDHQEIATLSTDYSDVTFKHLLLPVWVSAYQFQAKTYRFLINARTGEVRGERPYSVVKIVLFILTILLAIAVIVLIAHR